MAINLIYTSAILSATLTALRQTLVDGNVMYLCKSYSPPYINGVLYSYDITNPAAPVQLDSIAANLVLDIKKKGNYVFASGSAPGVGIIYSFDVSDPSNLVIADSLAVDAGAHGIDLYGNYLYVACFDSDRFRIVDITDPTNIILRGFSNHACLDGVHDVVVDATTYPHAYVTSHYGTGHGVTTGEVSCFDVSDPDNPTFVSLSAQKSQFCKIVKLGNYLYVGGYDGVNLYLYSFDVSNPHVITLADSLVNAYGYYMALLGVAQVVTVDGGSGIPANKLVNRVDITDPLNMSIIETWTEVGTDNPRSMAFKSNRYGFFGCSIAGGAVFKVLDFGAPAPPSWSGKGANMAPKLVAAGAI